MSEINLSDVCKDNDSKRIDSEYYQKKYIENERLLTTCNPCRLDVIAKFLIGPFGSSYDTSKYVESPEFRYIRGQDVQSFFLNDDNKKYMSKEDFLAMVDQSRDRKEVKISREEMRQRLLK